MQTVPQIKPYKANLVTSGIDFYMQHLRIINAIVPERMIMRLMEIRVLAAFMSLEGELKNHPLESFCKKIVREELGLSPSGLSNHIKELWEKGYISDRSKNGQVVSTFKPANSYQVYQISLKLD